MTGDKETLRGLSGDRDLTQILKQMSEQRGDRSELLRRFTETMTDSVLSLLNRESLSVEEWESGVRKLSEDERFELSERFVVVSREGLRSLVSLLIRDSSGITHNFDSIREIVSQVPESERPQSPDEKRLTPQERNFVRRATRELCSTDCPRFCQGDCPFERVEDCPRYKEMERPVSDDEFNLSL